MGAKALESLPAAAVAGNGKIDSVSGATITTKGFREAIADAIKNHSAKKQ
ncbi:MAG: FMN-binding protein [Sutterella wadsworthensis]